jgi:hypothetical protein
MLRTLSAFGILGSFGLVSLVGATGCSSSSSKSSTGSTSSADTVDCSSASCPVCTGPSAADAAAPVSFSNDVLPVFQRSCGIGAGTCHGSYPNTSSQQNLYLAEPTSAADGYGDAGAILTGIVGKASLEAPSMNIVTAGDPDNSYLIHKINGDMCQIMSDCAPLSTALPTAVTTPCGVPMPQTGGTIGTTDQTLVWNWILQGAQNN